MSDRYLPIRKNVARRISGGRQTLHEYSCLECGNLFLAGESTMRRASCTGKCRPCSHKKHGMTNDNRFKVWMSMRDRCNNPNSTSFSIYGGRGITVCDEWETFEGFMRWDKFSEYSPGLQLDRIDNDGNYEPSNCRWVTCQENNQNRRVGCNKLTPESVREIRSLYKSGQFTQKDISERFGINRMSVSMVLRGKTWGNIQ